MSASVVARFYITDPKRFYLDEIDVGYKKHRSAACIPDLPDEIWNSIFQKLDSIIDQESLGLTCHRFFDIQRSSIKHLKFKFSHWLTSPNFASIDNNTTSHMLHRLLNRYRQLESLTLSLNSCKNFSDSGLVLLREYGSKLRSIHLDFCPQITNIGFSSIAAGCRSLTVINLYSCSINDSGLETLTKSCNLLTEVNIGWCVKITDNGITALTQNCRQLRALTISGCDKIHGLGFKGCSPTLACLEADYCTFFSGLTDVLSGGGLEYLNLGGDFKRVSGHKLEAVGLGFGKNLKILNMWGCGFVKDGDIISISKGCPLLREWNLSYCGKITVSGWESVGFNCRNLEKIHVSKCLRLCDRGLLAIGDGCRRLCEINMICCPLITSKGIEVFKMLRKDVEIKQLTTDRIIPNWAFNTLI